MRDDPSGRRLCCQHAINRQVKGVVASTKWHSSYSLHPLCDHFDRQRLLPVTSPGLTFLVPVRGRADFPHSTCHLVCHPVLFSLPSTINLHAKRGRGRDEKNEKRMDFPHGTCHPVRHPVPFSLPSTMNLMQKEDEDQMRKMKKKKERKEK